jgi:mRNA interferase MazF
MGHYSRGDVVISPVACEERGGIKTRPAVVVGTGDRGEVYVCPISSKPSSDTHCIPVTLDDFSEGGLDLFGESYILTSRVFLIRNGAVVGKRGRLTNESVSSVITGIPQSLLPGNEKADLKKGSRTLRY